MSRPGDWASSTLESVCVAGGLVRGPFGGSLKKSDFVATGFQVYEQRNAIQSSIDGRYFISPEKFRKMSRFAVREDDFIVSCSGTIGRIFRIPSSAPPGIINQALLKLTIDAEIIDTGYFEQYFCWDGFQGAITDSTQGGAMKNLVGMPVFKKTEIIHPGIDEQRAIATALGDVDELIKSLDALLAKKQAIKQGMIQELLTGRTRLPGYSQPWKEVRLGDHVTYVKTVALSRAQLDEDSPLRCLHYGDIHTTDLVTFDAANIDMPRAHSALAANAGRLQVGDLVFADASEDASGVGRSVEIASVPVEGLVAGLHTIAARFEPAVLADGFKAYLQCHPVFRASLLRLAAGTKVLATTRSCISSISLLLPDVDEQKAIAEILGDVESEIRRVFLRLAKARNIKQGMMQELLSGRTRLLVEMPL